MPHAAGPDGRELLRLSCPECRHTVVTAIWCRDPRCCDQDPGRFIAALIAAEQARGVPVFAVRPVDAGGAGSPAGPVTLWRAGDTRPVYTGAAAAAVEFALRHECRPA